MSPKIEKRIYGKISFPMDKIKEIKKIVALKLTSAANVSEYVRMNLDTKIQSDLYRVDEREEDIKRLEREEKELGAL